MQLIKQKPSIHILESTELIWREREREREHDFRILVKFWWHFDEQFRNLKIPKYISMIFVKFVPIPKYVSKIFVKFMFSYVLLMH